MHIKKNNEDIPSAKFIKAQVSCVIRALRPALGCLVNTRRLELTKPSG